MKTTEANTISTAAWVLAARNTLIEKGIAGVKIEALAHALGVTSGSFYWHFPNRSSLYDWLLCDWLENNVTPFTMHFYEAVDDPRERFLALAYTWLLCPNFDPSFDMAVRGWTRISPNVAYMVREVDCNRIELYKVIFNQFGLSPHSAVTRGKAMYYHQIGYHSMRIEEPLDDRLIQIPEYTKMFTGDDWLLDSQTADQVQQRLAGFRRHKSAKEIQM